MATLVLQVAGAAAGSVFGPLGSMAGRALGGLAGAAIDRTFLNGGRASAPLRTVDVTASTEGTPVARAWGRVRLPGQIIWASRVEAVRSATRSGGKGGGGGPATENVSYFANLALGLCEGPVARIGRIWADGQELDAGAFTLRLHNGAEDQEPDPLIVAKEGAENAPAYRGLSYLVFERMPLAAFGNRVPQLHVEVMRPVGKLERQIRAMTMIPGSSEFAYDTRIVERVLGIGESVPENRHTHAGESDFIASLDELVALCPNLKHISLVVAWFGDDLRAGACTIAPRVDSAAKKTRGAEWSVAGLSRASARVVSLHEGRPAYGGSPSDGSVIRAIRAIKERGIGVTLYPFLMMDIPAGNDLPDPVSGLAPQPPYPWRGTIRAAGDGTSAAGEEIARFFGTASASDFAVAGEAVSYSGPSEWGWRRFVLHMAALGQAGGGVDALVIGSEFRDLTQSRDDGAAYPAVAELVHLASEVRALAGPGTKITYAADWTERGAHVRDGGNEVRFPLDPLWASDDLDAIGVDFYPPFADWRDGAQHLDRSVADSIYDAGYLGGNVTGGEAWDWYYLDDEARRAQERVPITDGLGKPWVYRSKDLRSWWENAHHERVGGVELPEPTLWQPRSKPIWLTEIGCPAVDKGANAPNMFPDPKSSAASLPPFSSGARDDLIQRRVLETLLDVYGAESAANPSSPIYDGPMVDPDRSAVWTWDARPYPAFPAALDVWSDGAAHETGHWLNGRLGQMPLPELTARIFDEAGLADTGTQGLTGSLDGYAVDRPCSVRDAIEPLADLYGFSACESDGRIVLSMRGQGDPAVLTIADLAEENGAAEPTYIRGQDSESPGEVAISFSDVQADFQPKIAAARLPAEGMRGIATMDTAITAAFADMQRRAEITLQDIRVGRDTVRFCLPPDRIALEAADVVALDIRGMSRLFEITEIEDGAVRRVSARAIAPAVLDAPKPVSSRPPVALPDIAGTPDVVVLDLPVPDGDPVVLSRLAVSAKPWVGGYVAWRGAGGSFEPAVRIDRPALMGETLDVLAPGLSWRFDRGSTVDVRIARGELSGASNERLFAGANACAIGSAEQGWEVLQFGRADLVAPSIYRLSHFLRGQYGTEAHARMTKPAGSAFVLLDSALMQLVRGLDALSRPVDWRVSAANRDHADALAVSFTAQPGDTALRPLAPVHVHAARTDAGIAIGWIRRDRINADAWDVVEIPMSETAELYRLDILAGAEIVRSVQTNAPSFLYASDDEIADFGTAQTSLSLRVAQVSASVGPGRFTEINLNV